MRPCPAALNAWPISPTTAYHDRINFQRFSAKAAGQQTPWDNMTARAV
jgi:hypothetical protein